MREPDLLNWGIGDEAVAYPLVRVSNHSRRGGSGLKRGNRSNQRIASVHDSLRSQEHPQRYRAECGTPGRIRIADLLLRRQTILTQLIDFYAAKGVFLRWSAMNSALIVRVFCKGGLPFQNPMTEAEAMTLVCW